MFLVGSTYAHFWDTAGASLQGGKVYIGVAGQNPETNPQTVYLDAGGTQPAAQPLSTTNGTIVGTAGAPTGIYVNANYSITVRDSGGNMVYSNLQVSNDVTSAIFTNVRAYGAKGDGVTDDTTAINAAITAGAGGIVYFPPGYYVYQGGGVLPANTIAMGAGRHSSVIVPKNASPTGGSYLSAFNSKTAIKSLGFAPYLSSPTQTSGYYVEVAGDEAFIEDFYMEAFQNGINMHGSVNKIRNGRMYNGNVNAIGILSDGGDNSQTIDSVEITAGPATNQATAGIKMANSTALTISDCAVLQQGTGLLIQPPANTNIFSLMCSNSFFDTCNTGMSMSASNGSGIYRFRFINCWFGSAVTGNGITLQANDTSVIEGHNFEQCQFVLAHQNGAYLGYGAGGGFVAQIRFFGCSFAQNTSVGMWVNSAIDKIRCEACDFGPIDGFTQNVAGDMAFQAVCTNVILEGNGFYSATTINNSGNISTGIVKSNLNFPTNTRGVATINSGATSVTVSHGLQMTPTQADIAFGYSSAAAGSANLSLTSWTATQLTFSVSVAPSSNVGVWWSARSPLDH